MRNLKKNEREMFYAKYLGRNPILDSFGDETGAYTTKYSAPIAFQASLSPGRGSAQGNVFGVEVDYSRTISTTEIDLPITETSLVWYETEPVLLPDGTVDSDSADYEVTAPPAKGLDVLVIALRKRIKNG